MGMIRQIPLSVLKNRALFLREIRHFYEENGYLEVETPLMNPGANIEAFLEPFRAIRSGIRKSPEAGASRNGFLITSPEYNLKILLADHRERIFQIAHCFREGDVGGSHTEEFLMLEWYRPDCDEFCLMEECDSLLSRLSRLPFCRITPLTTPALRLSVDEAFERYAGCGLGYEGLLRKVESSGLLVRSRSEPRYDELFFLVFLNEIERHLGHDTPCFLYGYPEELAALSRCENGRARRFEIYWKGSEVANGYFELTGREAHEKRFLHENTIRLSRGEEAFPPEERFLGCCDRIPDAGGVALGLDRLFMVLCAEESFKNITPFP